MINTCSFNPLFTAIIALQKGFLAHPPGQYNDDMGGIADIALRKGARGARSCFTPELSPRVSSCRSIRGKGGARSFKQVSLTDWKDERKEYWCFDLLPLGDRRMNSGISRMGTEECEVACECGRQNHTSLSCILKLMETMSFPCLGETREWQAGWELSKHQDLASTLLCFFNLR